MSKPNKAEFDQMLANMRDVLPSMWWSVYVGCTDKGFSPAQALELTKTYITASTPRFSSDSSPEGE